jgi:uncharacterized cupredoxin-like copper-binding protein
MTLTLKTTLAATILAAFAASPALADAGHSAAGEPGKAAQASKTIIVSAKETGDGRMIFEPNDLRVGRGETVRIVLENAGELEHELTLGTAKEIEKHAEQMRKFPEMEHAEPNAVRVDPGHRDEINWQFTKEGTFQFACLIPGHMESGMHGEIAVVDPAKLAAK